MKYFILLISFLISTITFSNIKSSEIYLKAEKLKSLKRILYVAAHPDDENTRALAYFSLGEKAETAYFSLTRGDGGQNLIGSELGSSLGVLRTQELLAARSYDGANQFFSRAVDFGYSKSAEESFEKWDKEKILSDLVLVIRKFQPDAIITRFPPDERGGHGHHTASALLAIEAYTKAADPNYETWQVDLHGTWQTASVYWNTSYWWLDDIAEKAKNNPDYLKIDIGGYNELLGQSYNEIGTIARSQHKCQGFGAEIERGSREEYFEHLVGTKLTSSFFEENKRTWVNIGGKKISKLIDDAIANFNFSCSEKNVETFLKIYEELKALPDSYFKQEKLSLCSEIIQDCLGLYSELLGEDYFFVKETTTNLSLQLINRSKIKVELLSATMNTGESFAINSILPFNDFQVDTLKSSGKVELSNPYWLTAPFLNTFTVDNIKLIGRAQSPPTLFAFIQIKVKDIIVDFEVPAEYKWRDPSFGERIRPMIATPEFSLNLDESNLLVKKGDYKLIEVRIQSFKEHLVDTVYFDLGNNWKVEPSFIPVNIEHKLGEQFSTIKITPIEQAESSLLIANSKDKDRIYSHQVIDYDHIPAQSLFSKVNLKCSVLDAEIIPGKIAYIKGVEDAIPSAIRQLGFDVDEFEVEDLSTINLTGYNTVLLGIRIYNVKPELNNFKEKLNQYVAQGGKVVVQYNTASRSKKMLIEGPYEFEVSRKRVTEEDAEVNFLHTDHPIMTTPNKIQKEDFDNWVQERGLYFADNWSKEFIPLFSWSDKGEEPVDGALIVATYGKGEYIYTGISFFRELPNGVLGAYRLFANILSY